MRISTSRPSSADRPTSRAGAGGAAIRWHGTPPTHLGFEALTAAGLPHATTTRHCPTTPAGGAPFSAEARTVFAIDGAVPAVAFARQVHGAAAARATGGGSAGEADVLLTTTAGLPAAIVTADCLPVVLYDPQVRALALAHVGWRGTVGGTARAAVQALAARGGAPARIVAAIGPSIGPCCYEVDQAVLDPLRAALGPVEPWITPRGDGRWLLDLWAVNEAELARAGVDPGRIANARLCTACRPDLFHSHRKGSPGRLVTLAMLPAAG